jgi:hypothetical protein
MNNIYHICRFGKIWKDWLRSKIKKKHYASVDNVSKKAYFGGVIDIIE